MPAFSGAGCVRRARHAMLGGDDAVLGGGLLAPQH
jgi:hypothetical protein